MSLIIACCQFMHLFWLSEFYSISSNSKFIKYHCYIIQTYIYISTLRFCVYRWILLCFKREFPENDALRMWEACWAHYQTDFFHLFICVAIISVYGEDVVQDQLPSDEMLLHFSSLSMHMSGHVVLKKVSPPYQIVIVDFVNLFVSAVRNFQN